MQTSVGTGLRRGAWSVAPEPPWPFPRRRACSRLQHENHVRIGGWASMAAVILPFAAFILCVYAFAGHVVILERRAKAESMPAQLARMMGVEFVLFLFLRTRYPGRLADSMRISFVLGLIVFANVLFGAALNDVGAGS